MEKSLILYLPEVEDYINDLIYILFQKEYFSHIENAIEYKDKIIDFVESSIVNFPHQKSPDKLSHLGSKYIFYKSNKRTTWYIFFENKKNKFLITFITNNHSENAKWLV